MLAAFSQKSLQNAQLLRHHIFTGPHIVVLVVATVPPPRMQSILCRRPALTAASSGLLQRQSSASTFRTAWRTYSTGPIHHPQARWGTLKTITAALGLSAVAATLGAIYPPPPVAILFPRVAPGPPADPLSPKSVAYTEELEAKLQSLPYLQKERQRSDAQEWYETRPYQQFPEERRVNNLTAGALRGPGKLALFPLIRVRRDESESLVFLHLGRGLCGHDGIIHGGLLATLLDETLARTVRTFFFSAGSGC